MPEPEPSLTFSHLKLASPDNHTCESEKHYGKDVPARYLAILLTDDRLVFEYWAICDDCLIDMRTTI